MVTTGPGASEQQLFENMNSWDIDTMVKGIFYIFDIDIFSSSWFLKNLCQI